MKYYPHTRLCMGSESWDPADIAKAKKLSPQDKRSHIIASELTKSIVLESS